MSGDFGGLGALLRHARELGGRMEGLNDELRNRRATGSAGGGLVEIEVNALAEVLRCRLDPQVLAQNDLELLEDLIVAAMNQAVGKARQLHAEAVGSLAGGISLPGLGEAIGRLLRGGPGEPEPPKPPPPS